MTRLAMQTAGRRLAAGLTSRLTAGLGYCAGAAALTVFALWAALAPQTCAEPGARPAVATMLFVGGHPADARCRERIAARS